MPVEEVLCVPTDVFRRCGHFEGFMPLCSNYIPLFNGNLQEFRPRNCIEDDPEFKQLIPYVLVEQGGRLLNYFRGKGSGESRLRGKRSVGIGGHINPCDAAAVAEMSEMAPLTPRQENWMSAMYIRGMIRELHEELKFVNAAAQLDIDLLGLINEDKTPVGQVHLGVVHVLHLPNAVTCTAAEEDIMDLDWNTWPALKKLSAVVHPEDVFEQWSRICLKHVNPIRPAPKKDLKKGK